MKKYIGTKIIQAEPAYRLDKKTVQPADWPIPAGSQADEGDAVRYPEIDRRLTQEEYDEVERYLMDSPIENGYFQELESAESEYVPDFDFGGVLPPEEK